MKKRRIWKGLGFVTSVLMIVSILLSGCGAPSVVPEPIETGELTEEYVRSLPPLCSKAEMKDIDFTVLKDVDYIVRKYSVFTSPVFKDTFGDTLKDQAYLIRVARDTLFCGFLAVPKDQIPQWAIDWVEEDIENGNYDYKVFNRIYQELLKDPQYEYLEDSSQKEKLLKVMIEGMIKALEDPFTHYYTSEQWILSEKGSSAGRYRGLGIGLSKNERGELAISNVSSGSPAEKVGLEPGDAILAVDEKSTLECTVSQFILHVKTRQNPVMDLIVRRKLTDALERVQVAMEEIKVHQLFTGPGVDLPNGRGSTEEDMPFYYPLRDGQEREHPGILYIKIKQFTVQAATDLRYVLSNLDMTKFKGVIVDLRENPGGRLDAILYCVDYFLPTDDIITTTKYADGKVSEYRHNQWNFVPEDMPIAILVDKNSASGAELFPAALRDNGRAVIISKDERTAGKGSVNNHFTLRKGEYGALYVSIGLWYTPSGEMIEKRDLDRDGYYEVGGLKPDILVEWTDEDIYENQRNPAWYDPTIFRAIKYITNGK